MSGTFLENKYFNTYYYSNIVDNILSGDIEFIGFISNFFSDEEILYHLAKPFPKFSAFHEFIKSMIGDFFEEDMDKYDQKIFNYYKMNKYSLEPLYAESAFKVFDIDFSFKDSIGGKSDVEYSDIEQYHDELRLSGCLEELYENISQEVFYIMFNNREALLNFNYMVAEHMTVDVKEIEDAKIKKLFTLSGKVKRVEVPEWCKKAVFFRDRGRCCICGKDISGLFSTQPDKHYDHIIPLAIGGLNDVSNIQLLCSVCNRKKSKYKIVTSRFYETWY